LENKLTDARFGYEMKRAGVKTLSKTEWSITYQRSIAATSETFVVKCALLNDTCRVYLDENAWKLIFER